MSQHVRLNTFRHAPSVSNTDNALPVSMHGMVSIQYGETFLLIGGNDHATGEEIADAYIFDPEGEVFNLMDGVRMSQGRRHAAAVLVDAQAFPQCDE